MKPHRAAPLSLPPGFEALLHNYVTSVYGAKAFVQGISALNRGFTSERGTLPKNYFNRKEFRSAYLLYFLPVNALKIRGLLEELPPHFWQRAQRILDLGCGPATATIGCLLAASKDWHGSVTLIDQNKMILSEGKQLLAKLAAQKIVATPRLLELLTADLQKRPFSLRSRFAPFDLIMMTNLLNELPSKENRWSLLRWALKQLAPAGNLVIVEPALRRPTRELMALHDRIVQEKIAWIVAPCLHQATCPMLAANRRDWCHTYLEWERPHSIAQFDRLVGIRKDYLKASYLIVTNDPPPDRSQFWRVVSGPLNSKGKSERLLCGAQGLPSLRRLRRLDRDRSESNRDFDQLQRGDIIRAEKTDQILRSPSSLRMTTQ